MIGMLLPLSTPQEGVTQYCRWCRKAESRGAKSEAACGFGKGDRTPKITGPVPFFSEAASGQGGRAVSILFPTGDHGIDHRGFRRFVTNRLEHRRQFHEGLIPLDHD